MPLPLPTSLSPSKVAAFTDCALAFRFSAIDRLPEPPSAPAVKGTLVHRALEMLFEGPAATRTPEAARTHLAAAAAELEQTDEFGELGFGEAEHQEFLADAGRMVERYFTLEDPRLVEPIGIELRLEVEVGDLRLRGIIDRLELDEAGGLVVTDYKTGKAPDQRRERERLGGVHFYAFMCEQLFGRRPSRVQLLYLGAEPQVITAVPTEQSARGLEKKVRAIWSAVETACARDDFRPRPSALCNWCAFQAHCPAFGGDPADVRAASAATTTGAT